MAGRPPHKVIPIFRDVEHLEAWFIRQRRLMLGLPINKIGARIPWGYKESEEDPQKLEPIERCFEYLVEAKYHVDDCTYEEVAIWLGKRTRHRITGEGLRLLLHSRMPDDRAQGPLRKRQKTAAKKIQDKTW